MGPQDLGGDRFPERRRGDVLVQNVVHRHRLRRDRPARVDQAGTAIGAQAPAAVYALLDILPADLANVVRAVTSRLKVDDANTRTTFGHGA